MARPLRIEFSGAVYQVPSRGDRREPIFVDDVDRRALLDVLGSGLDRFDVSALAWCQQRASVGVEVLPFAPQASNLHLATDTAAELQLSSL